MTTVIFRADGNSMIGLGHFFRILALADMVKEHFVCYCAIKAPDGFVKSQVEKVGIRLMELTVLEAEQREMSTEDEVPFDLPDRLTGDEIVVLDGYRFGNVYQKKIKDLGCSLVYIDDIYGEYPYADAIVNHSISASPQRYKNTTARIFNGPDYGLLRKEFLEESRTTKVKTKFDTAFVCFGGADTENLGLKVSSFLVAPGSPIETVNLLNSSAYKGSKEMFENLARRSGKQIIVHTDLNAPEIINVMNSSDFAVVSASNISYECACAGLPMIIGYSASNQEDFYSSLCRRANVAGIGKWQDASGSGLFVAIEKLIAAYNPNVQGLIDGFQKDRFIALLKSLAPEKLKGLKQTRRYSITNEQNIAVLATSISRKTGLLKALRKAADKIGNVKLIGGDIDNKAIGKYFVDDFWQMPILSELSVDTVINYCEKNHVRLIVPSRDSELLFWSSIKGDLNEKGIEVMVSSEKAVQLCLDKLLFFETLNALGFPAIPTVNDINQLTGTHSFVVKEQFGAGSESIGLGLNKAQAIEHSRRLKRPIFQPYILGEERSVDIYIDKKGKAKGVVARKRDLVVNGESQITTSVIDPSLEELSVSVVEKIQLYGHVILQVIIDQAGQTHIIECNSRFGGASTLSLHCGLDSFYWALLEANGIDISDYPFVKSPDNKTQIRFPDDLIITG